MALLSRRETTGPLTEATFLILAALVQPRHGYAVMQWTAEATGRRVQLGPGTLYGALTSLQERGLIAPMEDAEARGEGGERRKVYALTPAGRALLQAETDRLESAALIGRKALTL